MGELYRDKIDLGLDRSQVPNWPERCRQCLALNNLDPNDALYCELDRDCEYFPFRYGLADDGSSAWLPRKHTASRGE